MNELDKLYSHFAGNDRMLSIIERTKDIRQQCVDARLQAEVREIDGVPAVIITLANKFELEIAICEVKLKPRDPQPFPSFISNVMPVYTDKIIGYEEILDNGCDWRLWAGCDAELPALWIEGEGYIPEVIDLAQVMKTASETEEGINRLKKLQNGGRINLVVKEKDRAGQRT
jgi:hypothetical protein